MNKSLSKRSAINIEFALQKINKMISDRINEMANNMVKYPASTIVEGIKQEAKKALADIIEKNTTEIRLVEQTLNTVSKTNTNQSSINNQFNTTNTPTT